VTETLTHLGEYVRELRKRLPAHYFRPVPARLLWMIPHALVIVGAALLIATDGFGLFPAGWSWLAKAGASLLIGVSFACLGFLGHEVLHGSVVKTPWLRDLVGAICFAQFNLGPKLWRKWHNVEHHGHTQHTDDDPDAMGTLEDYRERKSLQFLYRLAPWTRSLLTFVSFSFWFSLHGFMMLKRYSGEFPRRGERAVVVLQFALPVAAWLSLLVWLGPVSWLFVYLIPLLIANFLVMSYIATNHLLNPLTMTNDPLANSLTVRNPGWLEVLHLNFGFHTEHHIFPNMSPRFATILRRHIQELWPDRYHEMPHWKALRALWKTPRLYRDDSNLIDPHQGHFFPVIGRGMDPDRIEPKREA
jgi:fatty acid desaturase